MASLSSQQVLALAKALLDSAQQGNWQQLAQLDRQVARLMGQLGPEPKELAPAVAQLASAHGQARALAEQQMQRLQQTLNKHQDRQEGLRAYQQLEDF